MTIGSVVAERIDEPARLIAHGDGDVAADAFRDVISAGLDDAYRLATLIVGDGAEAEDAVHDACLAAWRHRSELRDPERAAAWFRRILVNSCRDRVRARSRRRVTLLRLSERAGDGTVRFDAVADLPERDALADALRRLDADDQVLLGLRYGLDLTVPGVAAATGIREGTVKSRLHRAISRLRADLTESGR